jgi:hypothetical protein
VAVVETVASAAAVVVEGAGAVTAVVVEIVAVAAAVVVVLETAAAGAVVVGERAIGSGKRCAPAHDWIAGGRIGPVVWAQGIEDMVERLEG